MQSLQSIFDSHFGPSTLELELVSHTCGQISRCLCFGSDPGIHLQFPDMDVAILHPGMHFTLLLAVNPSMDASPSPSPRVPAASPASMGIFPGLDTEAPWSKLCVSRIL